jgi:hypothetical protein
MINKKVNIVCTACHWLFVSSINFQSFQYVTLPGSAKNKIIPEPPIIKNEIII